MTDLGQQHCYLTIRQAADRLRRMGPAFESITERRVRSMADRKVLPFAQIPGLRERVISENALLAFFQRWQLEAERTCRRAK